MNPQLEAEISGFINASPQPEGWCSLEKAVAMAQLITEQKPHCVVEIGVFGGRSLIPQAMAIRANDRGMIYGIDPWKKSVAIEGENSKENDEWWLKLDLEGIAIGCMHHVWNNKLDSWATIIRAPSQNCRHLFPSIDILHIDGAHSELASVRDVLNYLPRVKPGGYVWFDDTDWETTKRAVALVESECSKVKMVGACALYRKR